MGSPPPPDAPSVSEQASASADIGFEPSPTGTSICGFKIPPVFTFNISFRLPSLKFDFPPLFFFALSLNCDLSNPIDAEVGFGGGRVSTSDSDPFEDEAA